MVRGSDAARGSRLATRGSVAPWLRGSVLRASCVARASRCVVRCVARCVALRRAASFCVMRCVVLRRACVVLRHALRRSASRCVALLRCVRAASCAALSRCVLSWVLAGTCGNFGLCIKYVGEPEYSMKRTPVIIYIIIFNKHQYLHQCTNFVKISNNLIYSCFLRIL